MFTGEEFPNADYYRSDLRKCLHTVQEIEKYFKELLNGGLEEAIDRYFNSVMIDAIYDEETETITLKKEIIVGDGVHTYSADTNTMTIGEE